MTQNVVSDQPLPAQKKSRRGLYSQTRNNRWKWMIGATAATATGVTTSQAGFITINLTGNFISASGGNHLNADLTGDGHPDVTITNAFYTVYPIPPGTLDLYKFSARVDLNGVYAHVQFVAGAYGVGSAQLDGASISHFDIYSPPSGQRLNGSIPITFTDQGINNGAPTKGSLEVTVSGLHPPATIQLDSLTFHIPDNGSSLALLALGVGGVLALRRWRAAQKRS
jgi:hypothetical protein